MAASDMRTRRSTLALLLCVACVASLVSASHAAGTSRNVIRLHGGEIPVHSTPSLGARLRSEPMHHAIHTLADATSARRQHFFVHVTRNLLADERAGLAAMLGAHKMHYVPFNTFVVYARAADVLRAEASHALVDWVGVMEGEHKRAPGAEEWAAFKATRVAHETPFSATRHYAPRGMPGSRRAKYAEERVEWVAELGTNPHRTRDDARALATRFLAQLDARGDLSEDVDVYAASANRLVALAPAGAQAGTVLDELRALHEVMGVSHRLPVSTCNAAAAQITQGNVDIDEFSPPTSRPLSLTGDGVLVAIADTGIDYDHCMFRDPNRDVTVTYNYEDPEYDAQHRKIHSYIVLPEATGGDYPDGHGTHTSGSIAGAVLDGSNADAARFNGIAHGARLVFQDVGDAESLQVPIDLESDIFEPVYGLGARIHSNSWGCSPLDGRPPTDCAVYLDQARQVDAYMNENDDFLVLFANGNANTPLYPERTVGSPATCKNCLSVGASMSAKAGWRDVVDYMDWNDWAVENGYSDSAQCCRESSPNDNWYCCKDHLENVIDQNDAIFGAPISPSQMATFSSTGPAPRDRFKPDLVAPGMFITSSHSDGNLDSNQCGMGEPDLDNNAALLSMMGTSMATPVTAGTAALLTEHLVKSGHAVTGSLLKAMLINSARQMGGQQLSRGVWTPLVTSEYGTPDNVEGYGRVDLSNVVDPSRTYFRTGSVASDGKGDQYSLGGGVSAVYVTLVWTDPAGTVQSADPLVNNLDLTVTADGTLYDFAHIANDFNNVEGLTILANAGDTFGSVDIMVGGNDVPVAPQAYSVVITTDVPATVTATEGVVYTKKSYHKGTNAALVGGVIGALLAVILIAGVVLFVRGRQARVNAAGQQTLLTSPVAPPVGVIVQAQQPAGAAPAVWPPQPMQPAYPGAGAPVYATPPQL